MANDWKRRRVVELLAEGCSVVEAATLTGCSTRTVQRAVEELVGTASGACGTFQLRQTHGWDYYAIAQSRPGEIVDFPLPPWRFHRGRDVACVYFVQEHDDAGPVKIGVSTVFGLASRLSTIRNGNPRDLHLRRAVVGGYELEHEFHERLAGFRLRGEWFDAHPEVLAMLSPEPVDHDQWEPWSSEAVA